MGNELKGIRINIKKPYSFTSTTKVKRWCINGCGKKIFYSCVPVINNPQNFYFYCPVCDRYFVKDDISEGNIRLTKWK